VTRTPGARGVWLLWADARTVDDAAIDALATDEDRQRLAAFAAPKRRREYLLGRALLRCALARHTGRPASSHRLETTETGKPFCVDGPALGLSHDGALVVCALSTIGEVGVDVQSPSPHRHTGEIATDHFAAEEREWLEHAPSVDAFYWLWVLKEAYLKQVGLGLAGKLDRLRCRIDPPVIDATAPARASLALYSLGDAFVGLAIDADQFDGCECERWTGEDIATSRLEPIARGAARTTLPGAVRDRRAS
jgi:4'-phosphopantetheinyl transferase